MPGFRSSSRQTPSLPHPSKEDRGSTCLWPEAGEKSRRDPFPRLRGSPAGARGCFVPRLVRPRGRAACPPARPRRVSPLAASSTPSGGTKRALLLLPAGRAHRETCHPSPACGGLRIRRAGPGGWALQSLPPGVIDGRVALAQEVNFLPSCGVHVARGWDCLFPAQVVTQKGRGGVTHFAS